MPSRGPGSAIVLTPPHSLPPAKTTWFMRASFDSTGGTGSLCDSPSGWLPGFWRCGVGVPYTSLAARRDRAAVHLAGDSAVEQPRVWGVVAQRLRVGHRPHVDGVLERVWIDMAVGRLAVLGGHEVFRPALSRLVARVRRRRRLHRAGELRS